VIDRFGERMSEFVLHDLNPATEEFEPIVYSAIYNRTESVLDYDFKKRPIYWYKYQTGHFPDSPKCGYNRAKCPVKRRRHSTFLVSPNRLLFGLEFDQSRWRPGYG
jgi:hypothetical protein